MEYTDVNFLKASEKQERMDSADACLVNILGMFENNSFPTVKSPRGNGRKRRRSLIVSFTHSAYSAWQAPASCSSPIHQDVHCTPSNFSRVKTGTDLKNLPFTLHNERKLVSRESNDTATVSSASSDSVVFDDPHYSPLAPVIYPYSFIRSHEYQQGIKDLISCMDLSKESRRKLRSFRGKHKRKLRSLRKKQNFQIEESHQCHRKQKHLIQSERAADPTSMRFHNPTHTLQQSPKECVKSPSTGSFHYLVDASFDEPLYLP